MNAIIGDNGIITRAQEANIQSSIASLEEFLQLKYTENYEEMAQYQSKIEGLTNVCSSYFYIPVEEGIGGLRYVIDSDGHALYLIKKSGLPEEIRESLVGGDAGAGEPMDYQSLNDVYGITTNLKVYYCSSGLDSIKGLAKENLDNDNPNRKVIDGGEDIFQSLKKFDKNSDGELSSSEVLSITDLEIDSTMNVSNIDDLYRFTSLRSLILKNLTLENLNGIRNCSNLTSIYLQSCVCRDYSGICGVRRKLNKLYFYDIDDTELGRICDKSTGIGGVDFSSIEYLGFFGNKSVLDYKVTSSDYNGSSSSKSITSITPLKNLSALTKEKVKYMYLNNNKITSLNGIEEFSNLYLLRVEVNNLESLAGLENINLTYLCAGNNKLGITEKFDGNIDIDEQYSDSDALKPLENNTNLYYLNIMNNSELKYMKYLSNLSTIRYFFASGLLKIADANNLIKIKNISSPNFALDTKYELDLLDEELTTSLDLSSKQLTLSNLESIKKCKNIYRLNLNDTTYVDNVGTVVSDTTVNERLVDCLSALTKMQYLSLKNISALNSIDFAKQQTGLVQLLLDGTHVSDLSKLDGCSSLRHLSIDYSNSSSTLTPTTIKNCVSLAAMNWPLWNKKDAWERCIGLRLNSEGCFNNITWPTDLEYFSCMGNLSKGGEVIDLSACANIKEINNYQGNNLRINASKLSYIMTDRDSLDFVGSGGQVSVYFDSASDSSFFGTWNCFQSISFQCITGNLSWLKNASAEFKTSVICLYTQGSYPMENVNIADLSDYVNLRILRVTNGKKTNSMGDISNLKFLADVDLNDMNISNLQYLPLKVLTKLRLLNCNISSIYYLKDCTSLEYLKLNGNPLQELSYNNDNSDSIRSVQVLVDLRKNHLLKSLFIEGNMFNDTQELKNLTWTEHSGF